MYRRPQGKLEVLLVHPGGPYWTGKDFGAWSIPKGKIEEGEDALSAAIREFREETGFEARPPFVELGMIRQKSGKLVSAWAFEGDCDPAKVRSITTTMEWPPRSGKTIEVPEVDKAAWYGAEDARRRIITAQWPLVEQLVRVMAKQEPPTI